MDSVKSEPLLDFIMPFPYWESKGKRQLISLNNTHRWFRYGQTKIKNGYKDLLKEFYIPTPSTKYDSLMIEYEVQRHNKRRVDAMNIVAFADKWFLDSLTETGWLSDDDNCYHMITPARYTPNITETQLRVIVRCRDDKLHETNKQHCSITQTSN